MSLSTVTLLNSSFWFGCTFPPVSVFLIAHSFAFFLPVVNATIVYTSKTGPMGEAKMKKMTELDYIYSINDVIT